MNSVVPLLFAVSLCYFISLFPFAIQPTLTPLWLKLLLWLLLGGGFVAVYLFFVSRIKTREEALAERQQKILNMLVSRRLLQQGGIILDITAKGESEKGVTLREMLADPNARVRVRGIEIIERKLAEEDPGVARGILLPFLADEDHRVRATACRTLYKYDKWASLRALEQMAKSPDTRTKLTAAWAFGEIKDPRGISHLEFLLKDPSKVVSRRAISELERIRDFGNIDDETRTRINNLLASHREEKSN